MDNYEGVLANLQAKRATLERERERLDMAIAALELLASDVHEDANPASPRAFVYLNIPQALAKYAKVVQSPQKSRQIADALRTGGMRASSKSFNYQVYNCLRLLSQSGGPWQQESRGFWSPRIGRAAQSKNAEHTDVDKAVKGA